MRKIFGWMLILLSVLLFVGTLNEAGWLRAIPLDAAIFFGELLGMVIVPALLFGLGFWMVRSGQMKKFDPRSQR
jgi:hypothetical protein